MKLHSTQSANNIKRFGQHYPLLSQKKVKFLDLNIENSNKMLPMRMKMKMALKLNKNNSLPTIDLSQKSITSSPNGKEPKKISKNKSSNNSYNTANITSNKPSSPVINYSMNHTPCNTKNVSRDKESRTISLSPIQRQIRLMKKKNAMKLKKIFKTDPLFIAKINKMKNNNEIAAKENFNLILYQKKLIKVARNNISNESLKKLNEDFKSLNEIVFKKPTFKTNKWEVLAKQIRTVAPNNLMQKLHSFSRKYQS